MNQDAKRATGRGVPSERHAIGITRMCLRSGGVQLPFALSGSLAEGEILVHDVEADEPIVLWSEPPRRLSGLAPLFERHEVQVNDQLVLEVRGDDVRIAVTKRPRRSRPKVTPSTWNSHRDEPRREPPTSLDHDEDVPHASGVDHDSDTTGRAPRASDRSGAARYPWTDAGPDAVEDVHAEMEAASDHPTDLGDESTGFEPYRPHDPRATGPAHVRPPSDATPPHSGRFASSLPWGDGRQDELDDDAPRAPRVTVRPASDARPSAAGAADRPSGRRPASGGGGGPFAGLMRAARGWFGGGDRSQELDRDPAGGGGAGPDAADLDAADLDAADFDSADFDATDFDAADRHAAERHAADRDARDPDARDLDARDLDARDLDAKNWIHAWDDADDEAEAEPDAFDTAPPLGGSAVGGSASTGPTRAMTPGEPPEAPPDAPSEAPRRRAARDAPRVADGGAADDATGHVVDDDATNDVTKHVADDLRDDTSGGFLDDFPDDLADDVSDVRRDDVALTDADESTHAKDATDATAERADAPPTRGARTPSWLAAETPLFPASPDRGQRTPRDAPDSSADGDDPTNQSAAADAVPDRVAAEPADPPSDSPSERPSDRPSDRGATLPSGVPIRAGRFLGGDLRTRLVRFLVSPEMPLIAKTDLIAKRFDLEPATAQEMLADIAEDPPDGLRLTPVREGAWRIERRTV